MGIIQCGSFTGNTTVNIGWEPQWIMIKRTDAAGDWIVIDSMRGCSVGGVDAVLNPNLSNAESVSNDYIDFTATGFITKNLTGTYIYTVIRRPNKPPTTGTQVYNAILNTGTDVTKVTSSLGLVPDLVIDKARTGTSLDSYFIDRLRGSGNSSTQVLDTSSTGAEWTMSAGYGIGMDRSDGTLQLLISTANANPKTYVLHGLKRAPGFFDVVCYTGTGSDMTVSHSLGVTPELVIYKARSSGVIATDWTVIHKDGMPSPYWYVVLNSSNAKVSPGSQHTFTATTFAANNSYGYMEIGKNYVAYLFASCPGVSKVGSYTGNGSSQTINCGFAAGARFFLVKATSTTGNWWVFDSARGIVSSFDPALALNSTAAEVTSADAVDNDSSGIIVNQEATCSINATGVNYVFLAIA